LFKPISQSDNNPTTDTRQERQQDELEPIQARRVYDAKTGTWVIVENAPTEPMDTIVWKDIPSSLEPPIYSTSAPIVGPTGNPVRPIGTAEGNSQLLSSYNVAVVLPFLSDRYNRMDKQISPNSEWALHYYSGMEMAYEELSAQGVKLNVSLLDSKASPQVVSNLVRTSPQIENAHLIIGPYLSANARLLADKVRTAGNVLVSPHSAASNVTADNPNYIQVNPTLMTHCQAIMQHATKRYARQQMILVAMDRPEEAARFAYFQDEYQRLNGMTDTASIRQLLIDTTKLDMQSIDLKPYLSIDRETVFIVPSWASEVFIYNLLRKIDLDRNEYQRVVVYGMPQWMNYERIDFDYYERLNVHVSSSVFIDDFNPDVRRFKRQFYERFGAIPNPEAYVGYDVARYFGSMLHKHGTRFQPQLVDNPRELLHTSFQFEPVIRPSASAFEQGRVERWENRYVHILKFQDFRFSRAD